ncbi:unnamed protein product [Schistocephalus solidus]|uniref:Uncharacterized protein n=1 Tax=Schistocephalus solidus TaxID=70667 RepID=A0A183S969_SCHSO|nr:unnamed protein product [Schistocephalus solidus]
MASATPMDAYHDENAVLVIVYRTDSQLLNSLRMQTSVRLSTEYNDPRIEFSGSQLVLCKVNLKQHCCTTRRPEQSTKNKRVNSFVYTTMSMENTKSEVR